MSETSAFKVGQRVVVTYGSHNGRIGTIEIVDTDDTCRIKLDGGSATWFYNRWFKPTSPPQSEAPRTETCEACGGEWTGGGLFLCAFPVSKVPDYADVHRARVCDACGDWSFGSPDQDRCAKRIRTHRSAQQPPAADGPRPSAEWFAAVRAFVEKHPEIEAVLFNAGPALQKAFWPVVGGAARGGTWYHAPKLDSAAVSCSTDGLRRFTRSELLAGASDGGTRGELFSRATSDRLDREIRAALAGQNVSTSKTPAPSDQPETVQDKFPDSWRQRCQFCGDKLGDKCQTITVANLGPQPPLMPSGKYHAECHEQVMRRLDAAEPPPKPQLPTCLCGATIFRGFTVGSLGDMRTVCAECFLKANPQPVTPAAAGGGEGRHPICWPEDSWMDAQDGEI